MAGLVDWILGNKLTVFLALAAGSFFIATIALGVEKGKCKSELAARNSTTNPPSTAALSSTNSTTNTTNNNETVTNACICETPPPSQNERFSQVLTAHTVSKHSKNIHNGTNFTISEEFSEISFENVTVIEFKKVDEKIISVILRVITADIQFNITEKNTTNQLVGQLKTKLSFIKRMTFSYKDDQKYLTITAVDPNADLKQYFVEEFTDPNYNALNVTEKLTDAVKKALEANFTAELKEHLCNNIASGIILGNVEQLKIQKT